VSRFIFTSIRVAYCILNVEYVSQPRVLRVATTSIVAVLYFIVFYVGILIRNVCYMSPPRCNFVFVFYMSPPCCNFLVRL
jgi:hypothetical protein